MQNQLIALHRQISTLSKNRIPQLSFNIESLSSLLKFYGQKLLQFHHMHISYKSSSEEYMQILLQQIRIRTRQIEDRSRHNQSSFDQSDLHRISYDETNTDRNALDWGDIFQVLEEAFGSSNTVRKGSQLLQTLNYQIHLDKLKNHKQTIQFIEWLQQAHRYKDQEMRKLLEFVSSDKALNEEHYAGEQTKMERIEATFPNLVIMVQNQFLGLCDSQKGYIRSIQELNHQVKSLISQLTVKELNNNRNNYQNQNITDGDDNKQNMFQEKEKTILNTSKRDTGENSQPTQKQLHYVMHDYQKLKTETYRLKQLLKSSTLDFLPIQRQLARHINIGNILETQINRVIREFNIHEESFWQIYELPQVESIESIVQHLTNINERTEHMTAKVNRILKCHIETKRNKNQLKISYIMQQIEQLLKKRQPQTEQIQQICAEVKSLTDGLLKDQGIGKGLLRIILGLDNIFSLLPISDSQTLGMIEEQKQRLLKFVGSMAHTRHQKSIQKQSVIITQYQRQIVQLKKQNEWLASRNQKITSENEALKEALQQIKRYESTKNSSSQTYGLQAKIKQLSFENGLLEQRLRDEKVKFEREKNNLHIEVRKTSVKLERLEKLALRKMDINVEKPPINIKKGKVVINSHL